MLNDETRKNIEVLFKNLMCEINADKFIDFVEKLEGNKRIKIKNEKQIQKLMEKYKSFN